MFGYITAEASRLTEQEIRRYGGCYCGLCRKLKEGYGFTGRMTLTYDMTFLVLVLTSLYEPEEHSGEARCPVHPLRRRYWWQSRFTDYAADLNLLLAWWSCMDDWEDQHSVPKRAMAGLISGKRRELEEKYPRQSAAIASGIAAIHRYEDGPEVSADRAADAFGALMGELFVYDPEEHWAPVLRQLGESLGRFIYIMDACMDYKSDARHNRPNPLRALGNTTRTAEGDRALLELLLSDAARALETLPLEQDLGLLRNIMYAGVWQKYSKGDTAGLSRRKKEEEQDERSI